MKIKLFFTALLLSTLLFDTTAQSTSDELGQRIFIAFKHDSTDLIQNYRLKKDEITSFVSANGVDTNSNQFQLYRSRYDDITKKLFDKCRSIAKDSLDIGLSWKDAELGTISLKTPGVNSLTGAKTYTTKLLTISFTCNNKSFLLLMEAFEGADKLWKIGNSINFFAPPNDND